MAELDLSLWKPRIEESLSLHARQHRRWRESQEMIEGSWRQNLQAAFDPDWTPVNYGKAYLSAVIASIYARNPYYFVNARSSRYLIFAKLMERVLNYLIRELAIKQQVKRTIVDAVLTGIGWIEVGYTATFGTLEPPAQDVAAGCGKSSWPPSSVPPNRGC